MMASVELTIVLKIEERDSYVFASPAHDTSEAGKWIHNSFECSNERD
jgi:hypothetical protein